MEKQKQQPQRLQSLDALRGFDMLFIMGGASLFVALATLFPNPFFQASELNKAIARLFDTYKHENFSGNFRHPFASVMAYQTQANMRDYLPMMLAGIFSDNLLFSVNKSEETNEEN